MKQLEVMVTSRKEAMEGREDLEVMGTPMVASMLETFMEALEEVHMEVALVRCMVEEVAMVRCMVEEAAMVRCMRTTMREDWSATVETLRRST